MTSSQRYTGATANLINPTFSGGMTALDHFVEQAKHPLPATASGTVFVEFVVNPDGSVGDFTVLKGVGMEADLEAVRIVSNMPVWTPGSVNGKPVRVKLVLPINFPAS